MANPNVGGIVDNLQDGASDDKAAGYVAADVLAGTYPGCPTRLINAAGATAYQMTPEQTRVQVTLSGAGALTITLPSPAACKGRGVYAIGVVAIGGGGSAVMTDPDGVIGTRTLVAATAGGVGPDCWTVFTDGTRWYEVHAVVNHLLV